MSFFITHIFLHCVFKEKKIDIDCGYSIVIPIFYYLTD